ncbi:MAG: bacteriohemerythrin [Anaerovoracaceae bacterium]
MAINWTEDLAVGISTIDEQHKTWFEKANQLFEAGKNGKSKEIIAETLDFLTQYTQKHFGDEEQYMRSINYPEYDFQRKAHAGFVAELEKIKKEYEESGGSVVLIINANQMIVDWLIKHISREDKKIGKYVSGL